MTKRSKFWYAVAAFAPIVMLLLAVIAAIVYFVVIISRAGAPQPPGQKAFPHAFLPFFFTLYGGMIVSFSAGFLVKALFIVKACMNQALDQEKKMLWSFLIFISILVAPFYWYFYMWKLKEKKRVPA